MAFPFTIRRANLDDLAETYGLGLATPELQIVPGQLFMEPEDLQEAIASPQSVFLLARDEPVSGNRAQGTLAGFLYARLWEPIGEREEPWASLMCMAVDPLYRKQGVASQLYAECAHQLADLGVAYVYGWAGEQALAFFKGKGFSAGRQLTWIQKRIR